jgi:hypothetical protein
VLAVKAAWTKREEKKENEETRNQTKGERIEMRIRKQTLGVGEVDNGTIILEQVDLRNTRTQSGPTE